MTTLGPDEREVLERSMLERDARLRRVSRRTYELFVMLCDLLPLDHHYRKVGLMQLRAERLAAGMVAYQPLDLAHDPRNFIAEAIEEIVDATNYLPMADIQAERRMPPSDPMPAAGDALGGSDKEVL